MKLLIITALSDYRHEVSGLLQQAGIAVFSVSDTTGYKLNNGQPNDLSNWFGSKNGEFESVFFFSFTDDDRALQVLSLVDQRNQADHLQFPFRAFVLPVESFTQI